MAEQTGAWVTDTNAAMLTDLYQLTMLQSYWRSGRHDRAAFSLYFRELPQRRNYMLAAGLDSVLTYLENLHFPQDGLDYLARQGQFTDEFLRWLGKLRFTGDVYAMPEGTPVFADEPLLEIVAPLPQAQLVETFVINQIQLQTLVASKASRVVQAARGRPVLDFGLRRMHGTDAGLKGARACYIAGVSATSNVLAGQLFGLPVTGTMAHSYVQSSATELAAFREFAAAYPQTVLLVDTYDTLVGVQNVIRLAQELGERFVVRAIRIDSGNLGTLAVQARKMLDEANLGRVQIFTSGGLDEWKIRALLDQGAPVDGFGVGTEMGVSGDAPALDIVYKLVAYGGEGALKTSPGKQVLPGRKQVFRQLWDGQALGDVIGLHDEHMDADPLLRKVMEQGRRLATADDSVEQARARAAASVATLPEPIRSLDPAEKPYPVQFSAKLKQYRDEVLRQVSS